MFRGLSEVAIEAAPPDALERRIAELSDPDPAVRRVAVEDFKFFGVERAKVGAALAGCLKDRDGTVRRMALAQLQSFPDVAAEQVEVVLAIIADGTGRAPGERTNAALLASRTAPPGDRVMAAFEKALAEVSEAEKLIIRSAIDFYRTRCAPPKAE